MPYEIMESCDGCRACVKICPVEAIREKQTRYAVEPADCIECGACGRICPHGSIRDPSGKPCIGIRRSEWERPRFDWEACMSCAICRDACPSGCIALSRPSESDNPHAYPALRTGKPCIGCGFCALECPVSAITMAVPVRERNEQAAAGR